MESRPRLDLEHLRRTFVPPRELGTGRPRDVRLTGGGRAVFVASVLLLAAAVGVGIGMYAVAVRQVAEQRMFDAEGISARGDIVRLWRDSGDNKQRWVSYRYTVDGRAYEGRSRMGASKWAALQVGSTLPVRYLRVDPARSVAAGVRRDAMPIWLPFVVSGAIAIMGALCLLLIQVQRRLLTDGRAAPAVVTAHKKVHTSHGGTHRSMTYTFPLLSGASAGGKSETSSKAPAVGSVICVLYDPERPRRNRPYPLSLVRPARA